MIHQEVKISPASHGPASLAGPAKGVPGEAQSAASRSREAEGLPGAPAPHGATRWTPGPALPFAFWRERRKDSVLHVVSITEKSKNMCWHF